jgi:hypothetical protein
VEGKDCQLAHIGLFANQDVRLVYGAFNLNISQYLRLNLFTFADRCHTISTQIATGEELAYDYRQNLLAGSGCSCLCGAKNCRGGVY